MAPTFHAVTRSDNLTGFGNVPPFTLRHSVGALKGSGAGLSGRLELWTNCDSRMKALSGNSSKHGIAAMCRAGASAGVVVCVCCLPGLVTRFDLGISVTPLRHSKQPWPVVACCAIA